MSHKPKRRPGVTWEKSLDAQHAIYRQAGLADIEKIPTPIRPLTGPKPGLRGRTVFTATYEKRRHVDFMGVLGRGLIAGQGWAGEGRCVRMEAKEVRGTGAVPLARLGDSQMGSLRRCHEMGGFAAILVCYHTGGWIVPFVNWRPFSTKNGKPILSINAARLPERGVQFLTAQQAQAVLNYDITAADWLSAVVQKGWL